MFSMATPPADSAPANLELGSLVSALGSSAPTVTLQDTAGPVAPPSMPAKPKMEPRYIHPELAEIGHRYGNYGTLVKWAISRMTDDYDLRDIQELLKREGSPLKSAQISVVLTRMKGRGEIIEIGAPP